MKCLINVYYYKLFLNRFFHLIFSFDQVYFLQIFYLYYIIFPDLEEPLSLNMPMSQIVQAMQRADSGLEIRDRMWLKITIPNAFIGTDMIDWLLTRVEGFQERRDARKYASHLLKAGFIRHTVNKITFSEQVSL